MQRRRRTYSPPLALERSRQSKIYPLRTKCFSRNARTAVDGLGRGSIALLCFALRARLPRVSCYCIPTLFQHTLMAFCRVCIYQKSNANTADSHAVRLWHSHLGDSSPKAPA